MTTLAQSVDASQKIWELTAPLSPASTHLRVDSEVVRIRNHTTRQSMDVAENVMQCRVWRGEVGTTAATHAQSATIAELIDPDFSSGGGGSLTVTDGVNPPVENVTSIQLPIGSVSDLGAGAAGAILPPVNLIGTDPDTTPFSVQEAAAQAATTLQVKDSNGGVVASVDSAAGLVVRDPNGSSLLQYATSGHLQVKDGAGDMLIEANSGSTNFGPDAGVGVRNDGVSGYTFFQVNGNAAPPDAFIFRGSCWFWFDKTEGAAKLMVKGKDQGDNIVTAAIPLA